MRVAVIGKGKLAVRIANWFLGSPDYDLVGVVPVFPEPTWGESLHGWCVQAGVRVYETHTDLPPGLDLVFSCFYHRILRKSFIERHRRVLNLHNSPLPKYRGVNPINWALKNGERRHGVTIHEIDEGIDTGPVVAQVTYPIFPETDEVRDVYARALEYGWALFKATAPLLPRLPAVPQNDAEASYYGDHHRDQLGDRASWTRAESRLVPAS